MRALAVLAFLAVVGAAAWIGAANREIVSVGFDAANPGGIRIDAPLFAVIFAAVAAGFVVGLLAASAAAAPLRRRLRAELKRGERLERLVADGAAGAPANDADEPKKKLKSGQR